MTGEHESRSGTSAVPLIKNELLTYAFQYINKSSQHELIKTICEFYSPDEIHAARLCLWDVYECHDHVVLQGSRPRTAAKSEGFALIRSAEDLICKGVLIVANCPIAQSPFCAVDLERLPKYAPEEVNLSSIMTRLAKIENTVKMNEKQIDENKEAISAISTSSKVPHAPCDSSVQPPGSYNQEASSSTVTKVKSFAEHAVNLRASGISQPQERTLQQTSRVSPEWEKQRQERRRILREHHDKVKAVTGSRAANASNSGVNLRKAVETKDIYIKEIDPDFREDDVKGYLTSNKIKVKWIRQILGKREGQKKSFKITIPACDYDTVMTDTFWPMGIECRQWLTNEQLRKMTEETVDTDDTPLSCYG